MNFNFELILFYAVIVCGLIALFDMIFLSKKRQLAYADKIKGMTNPPELKLPMIIDYARSFFPLLLLVFLLRSFFYEPFRIPSGSLEPTLSVGDFILVSKYQYGIRLPIIHKKIISINEPKRGDIVVFRWPPNPSINFIKRVIGLPGDHISYINKILYVNGKEIPQEYQGISTDRDDEGHVWQVQERIEDFFGIKHSIYENDSVPKYDFKDIIVPEGMYFMMGDNRDNSADSRIWGFVPEANILGKANYVWMSWNSNDHSVRWHRLGKKIH